MDMLMDLIALHPKIFRGSPPAVPSELPEGWFALVDTLCSDIEALVGPDPERFEVTQIKEKFGSLRFYFSVDGAEDLFVDLQFPGGVRTLIQRADGPAAMTQVRALVAEASLRSTETCQECGTFGTRANRSGWLSVLCKRHAALRPG